MTEFLEMTFTFYEFLEMTFTFYLKFILFRRIYGKIQRATKTIKSAQRMGNRDEKNNYNSADTADDTEHDICFRLMQEGRAGS